MYENVRFRVPYLVLNSILDLETDGQTDEETSVRPFVRLSLCPLCLSGASILWGTNRDAS